MRNIGFLIAAALCGSVPLAAHAQSVYAGGGFPGLTVGYEHPVSASISLRGEYLGGLDVSRTEQEDGIVYDGRFKAKSVGLFADFYPVASRGFRVTGGVTYNDIDGSLRATGSTGTATVNGKPVVLAGESYNIDVKYPRVTPYIGVGYQSTHGRKGWGFFADAGFLIGKFKTTTTTTLVGRQGITQADVDAQSREVSDSVSKLSVLPKVTAGVTYSF